MKIIILILFMHILLQANFIHVLDVKKLNTKKLDGFSISELSALAYDKKTLYALSDKAHLIKFKIKFKNKKIKLLEPFSISQLRTKKTVLKKNKSDSEGMVYVGSKLLVAFEKKPRLRFFNLNAKQVDKVKMNKQLYEIKDYRAKNKMLEAVAYNDKYGAITTPELPLKQFDKCKHTLYTKNKTFDLESCGNITALEFISEDELLVLFRDTKMIIINLLDSNIVELQAIKKLKKHKFEGLTKLDENLYLMVSDNDDSLFQKTLFVLFEIKKD